MTSNSWKKGKGKLGIFEPLLGSWETTGDSPMGPMKCIRTFTKVLDGNYIRITANWEFASKTYEEITLVGTDQNKITFWSFTSDGKRSTGEMTDGSEIHPQAICFEAQMPAGIARLIYWPDDQDGFFWAVESKNKKGWNRFTEHHYKSINSLNN